MYNTEARVLVERALVRQAAILEAAPAVRCFVRKFTVGAATRAALRASIHIAW